MHIMHTSDNMIEKKDQINLNSPSEVTTTTSPTLPLGLDLNSECCTELMLSGLYIFVVFVVSVVVVVVAFVVVAEAD